ncbi:hypothetical protein ACIBH1_44860 [Nonomuraea sp. NPDC050663]|uniref:hypothetical protein n=1 Tax=Nonomuraea sp. NPDC050663 TaxID=3364370 RepID=UPI0037A9FEE3
MSREHRSSALGELLAIAASVLDATGPAPAATVTCLPHERFLPAITLTPASLWMSVEEQFALPRLVAERMGWPLQPLSTADGYASTGTLEGVRVQALAAPLPSTSRTPLARGKVTTAEHADPLRALVDWAASLPTAVTGLEVREDLDGAGQLTARLIVPRGFDVSPLNEVIMPVPADDWSGLRGAGILPTGHALTISEGR